MTRNADIELRDDEADDLLEFVSHGIARRRFGAPVRLEVAADISADAVELLTRELGLDSDDVIISHAPLDLTGLRDLYALDRPDLKFDPHNPRMPDAFKTRAGRATSWEPWATATP